MCVWGGNCQRNKNVVGRVIVRGINFHIFAHFHFPYTCSGRCHWQGPPFIFSSLSLSYKVVVNVNGIQSIASLVIISPILDTLNSILLFRGGGSIGFWRYCTPPLLNYDSGSNQGEDRNDGGGGGGSYGLSNNYLPVFFVFILSLSLTVLQDPKVY